MSESEAKKTGAAWLLAAVPLVGAFELALHVRQTSQVVPEADWTAARDAVKADLRKDDLVTFAPFWADPLGRRYFGDAIATMKREGRSDEARFPRAFEVSIRGAHDASLDGFRLASERTFGAVTVRLYENPAPVKVIDDLLDLATPDRLTVSRVDANGEESPCFFQHGATSGGSTVVPQGLLVPADKFQCGGGFVGVAVLHALDHHPHVCLYATPLGRGATLRLRFSDVTFGTTLEGHSGVQWLVERNPSRERVLVSFSAFGRPIADHVHRVGSGWGGFVLPTDDLAGKKGELVADVVGSQNARQFCFEATTRKAGGS